MRKCFCGYSLLTTGPSYYPKCTLCTAFSFWILKKNLSQKRNWEFMEALIGCSSEASRMGGISEIKTSCFWSWWSEINFRHIPPFSIGGGPKTLMGDQRAGRLKNLVSKRAEGSKVPKGYCMYISMFSECWKYRWSIQRSLFKGER